MTNKLKYFIGNWKMFGDFGSFKIIRKINQFSFKSKNIIKNKRIVMCVPNTLIFFFSKKLKSKYISLGAQNCHYFENSGPFTGAVNASMIKKSGARYVILGHSENRAEGDTNQIIKKKILSALKSNLTVIHCIGETFSEKQKKKTFSVLRKQIKNSLEKKFNINKIIFAYEPVWSIGTNKTPSSNELKKNIKFIKGEIQKKFRIRSLPKVLYGGSVNGKNISIFSGIDEIDGFLIGGASLSSKKFIDIIKNYYK